MQAEKQDAHLRKAVAAHKGAEGQVEAKRKAHAAAQKQALQLERKAGRQQKDAVSQVRAEHHSHSVCSWIFPDPPFPCCWARHEGQ